MRIVPVQRYQLRRMLLELSSKLDISAFEFAVYNPSMNIGDYGQVPKIRKSVPVREIEQRGVSYFADRLCESGDVLGLSSHVDEKYVAPLRITHLKAKFPDDLTFRLGFISGLHLPQIDFECPVSSENERRIYGMLEEIGQQEGYLLVSGQSYHFLGCDLLPLIMWQDFMQTIADWEYENDEAEPLVDENYPWVMEEMGYSVLRFTTSSHKKTRPRVISVIEDDQLKLQFDFPFSACQ